MTSVVTDNSNDYKEKSEALTPSRSATKKNDVNNNMDKEVVFEDNMDEEVAFDIEQSLIKAGVKNYKNLAGKTTIAELINIISSLDMFITGDSGPMHISAAFQIPTVSIFGPTRDYETSQWMNKKNIIVKKNLSCQPCMERRCPLGHHNCMQLIEEQEIVSSIKLLE